MMIALGAVHSFVLAPSLRASAVHAMPKNLNMAMHLDEAALASVFHKVDKDHSVSVLLFPVAGMHVFLPDS